MPLDAEKLLKFPIPMGQQTLIPRDIAFYALSIGMGADPLDERQLPFVDPLCGPIVTPSMVLVMAHPGFWLAHPDSGVDPTTVLHASQGFKILASLPQSGVVESSTRIAKLVDRGQGKAALINTITELTQSGRPFARLDRVTYVRGGGGFGGRVGEVETRGAAISREMPASVVDLPVAPSQALLYRLNGDLNPLHSDPVIAAKAGYPKPILHGLCTMGVVTHAILKTICGYNPDALRSMSLSFINPVLPGETIRTEVWPDGRFQARVVERDTIVVDRGECVVDKRASAAALELVT